MRFKLILIPSLFLLLTFSSAGFAHPHFEPGATADWLMESYLGRLYLGLCWFFWFVIFPFWVYSKQRHSQSKKKAHRDLSYVASNNESFMWPHIKGRGESLYQEFFACWNKRDLSMMSDKMDKWGWQHLQQIQSESLEQEGFFQTTEVMKIISNDPIYFEHKNLDGKQHEGSTIVLCIKAKIKKSFVEKSGDVIKGTQLTDKPTELWTLSFVDGKWILMGIEESKMAKEYRSLQAKQPPIEETMDDWVFAA